MISQRYILFFVISKFLTNFIFIFAENNNLITILGHTHRPRFPSPGDIAFFNDGSCVHPRSITGIEIENGEITLIKWQISTKEDGTLQIIRDLLEGPQKLIDYKIV